MATEHLFEILHIYIMSVFNSVNSFDSISDTIIPFVSGWMSIFMFDQGHKVRKAADEDILIRLTVMALLTLSYVRNITISITVFLTYLLFRVLVL